MSNSQQLEDKLVEEGDINPELTKKAKNDPKYQMFMEWALKNGVIYTKADFPVAFGPTGVIGVAATEDIPPLTSFIAIPNRLLITPKKIKASPIGHMINAHPEQFQYHNDADFNTLAIFLLYEKLKGEQSFFFPMLNAFSDCSTLANWDKSDLDEVDDPYLIKEAQEYRTELENSWIEVKSILDKYPEHFAPTKLNKMMYIECYEMVMTRCFGWTLPATMIVPFADFMNHSDHGTTHYIVNTNFEENEDKLDVKYMIKKRKIDLSFLNEKIGLDEVDKKNVFKPSIIGLEYCHRHLEYLNKQNYEIIMTQKPNPKTMRKIIGQVNLDMLKNKKEKQIWELNFYDDSDQEDNDSEVIKDEEEKDSSRKIYNEISKDEVKKAQLYNDLKKKETKITQNYDNNNIEDKVEEDEKNSMNSESDEEIRIERNKYRYENGLMNEDFSPEKYLKYNTNEIEKLEMDKLSIKETKQNKIQEDEVEEEEEEEDDDTDWTWFDDNDDENYFVVSTDDTLSYKKGEQIYCCYGRRTNKFLLMWYGFVLKHNKYDSLSFRLWMNRSTFSGSNPQKLIFKNYITGKEWKDGMITENGNQTTTIDELTREFRVKSSRLCEDVLAYLRAHLLLNYKGKDLYKILVTIPTSLAYEEYILNYAIILFNEIKKQFKTTIQQDEINLKDPKFGHRKRFAILLSLGHKKIIEEQIKLIKTLLLIINKLKLGLDFKTAYMTKHLEFDKNDEDFYESRKKMSNYLRLLHENCIQDLLNQSF